MNFSTRFVLFWKNSFFIFLAMAFSVFVMLDLASIHYTSEMQQTAFDLMVRHRVITPPPDPEIVIIDINEESLASMAPEYGRWPWPRQVLGEFLEHLEEQRPKAVVFDMLFSDPDIYNAESDSYFAAAVARTTSTFFPFLRLDEATDAQSRIRPSMIPGVVALSNNPDTGATIGVVLPCFREILNGGRLGLNNIYPDGDGVAREYLVYRDDYGWKVPSLPFRVAQELGFPQPNAQQVLLNWRGPPSTYASAPFSRVYFDMLNKVRLRPLDEFTGKIVIIGSTATSLFDVKPTPMSTLHPGVEILATAIDNFKHGDFLLLPDRRAMYFSLTLLIIWATAFAFAKNVGKDKIDSFFGVSQFVLLGISFATLNFTRIYIDLTGPVTVGLVHFTLARIYGTIADRVLETNSLRRSERHEGELAAFLLLIDAGGFGHGAAENVLKSIRRRLVRIGSEAKSVEMIKGRQEGIWAIFEEMLAVSWIISADDEQARDRVKADVEKVIAALREMPSGNAAKSESWYLHESRIPGGSGAKESWRVLFAEAQLGWLQRKARNDGNDGEKA